MTYLLAGWTKADEQHIFQILDEKNVQVRGFTSIMFALGMSQAVYEALELMQGPFYDIMRVLHVQAYATITRKKI